MAKGLKLFIFLLGLAQITQAQVVLMIEDQTKSGFKLVMNGFIQNETALPKLNLQKFPAGENQIILLLEDGKQLQRMLPALEKGIHQYVIYQDFKGKVHIRYRGISAELSQSAIMIDYHKDQPYTQIRKPALAQADTLSRFPEFQAALEEKPKPQESLVNDEKPIAAVDSASLPTKPKETVAEPEIAQGELKPEEDEPSKPANVTEVIVATNPKQSTPSESTAVETEITEPAKPEPEIDHYQSFTQAFSISEFEFDKLKLAKDYISEHSLDATQVVTILKGLKYDQSRLDFLQFLITKEAELKNSEADFIACFDYDLSKEQAKKLFIK